MITDQDKAALLLLYEKISVGVIIPLNKVMENDPVVELALQHLEGKLDH